MEVHKHPHHVMHKKKWNEYLLEFLMLFLAVFLGFIAENIREHSVETSREKEFVRSMIEDLEDDHVKLNEYVTSLRTAVKGMDTLITLLSHDSVVKRNSSDIYYLARVSPRIGIFSNNTRTLEQLKNSGSFRLIRKGEVANKIMSYYDNNFIPQMQQLYLTEFDEYKRIASGIFDPAAFRAMEKENGEIIRGQMNVPLRTYDPEKLKQLGVYAVYMNGSRRSILPAAETQMAAADQLIAYLKEQYHLK